MRIHQFICRPFSAVLAAAVVGAVSAPALAAPIFYSISGLTDGGSIQATAINGSGEVTGYATNSTGNTHAFIYSLGGSPTDIGTLGGTTSYGEGLNASGVVVGYSPPGAGASQAFSYTPGASPVMKDLGTLNTSNPAAISFGYGINDSGTIVGAASNGTTTHGYYYDGTMHDIGSLAGAAGLSQAVAINNSDQITGYSASASNSSVYHAFVDTVGGSMLDITPGTTSGVSSGRAISGNGLVAGYYSAGGVMHAFSYQTAGSSYVAANFTDLGTLATGKASYASDVNNDGVIVGYAMTASNNQDAVVWIGGTIEDLNTLFAQLDPTDASSWKLQEATSINYENEITGYGVYNDPVYGPITESFVLDISSVVPASVPEPASVGLLAVGGVMLLRRKRA